MLCPPRRSPNVGSGCSPGAIGSANRCPGLLELSPRDREHRGYRPSMITALALHSRLPGRREAVSGCRHIRPYLPPVELDTGHGAGDCRMCTGSCARMQTGERPRHLHGRSLIGSLDDRSRSRPRAVTRAGIRTPNWYPGHVRLSARPTHPRHEPTVARQAGPSTGDPTQPIKIPAYTAPALPI